jgi:hypothetical protein
MTKVSLLIRCLWVLAVLIILAVASPAQLVIGQYEDEAPLRTWNTFGLATAASTGRGETMLAQADDCSAALSNPALLAGLPRFTLSLNGSYSASRMFRYSIVNTGVLFSERNQSVGVFGLDFAGFSARFKGWTVAVSAALSELYDRPPAYARTIYGGVAYSALRFDQSGFLRTFNLAVARSFGRRLQAGLGLNLVRGKLDRTVQDSYFADGFSIDQEVHQSFSGFYLNGGLLARLTDRWDLAFAFRTPFDKRSDSEGEFRYQAPQAGTDIVIAAGSKDVYRQPWAAGIGARFMIPPRFRVLGDLTYFHWPGYRADYFGEEERRDFGPAFKAAIGGEYAAPVRLFNRDATVPLRFGLGYDRQPMRSPRSGYTTLSIGTGLHLGSLAIDIGGQYGLESGSGHRLETARVCLSLSAGL